MAKKRHPVEKFLLKYDSPLSLVVCIIIYIILPLLLFNALRYFILFVPDGWKF